MWIVSDVLHRQGWLQARRRLSTRRRLLPRSTDASSQQLPSGSGTGALYASRVTTATLHALAGLPAPPGAAHRLAAAVASGAGTRVAALVPPAARAAVDRKSVV